MFTGIITDVGEIVSIEDCGSAKRVAIACAYPQDSIPIGASIANDGICLTVTSLAARGNRDTVFTVGVNWTTTKWTRVIVNAIHEDIEDANRAPNPGTTSYWSGLIRLNIVF